MQAAELISLFMNISSYSLEETSPEMIIRSIITNEQMQIRELSAKHGIDVAKIQRMWLLGGGSMGDFKQKRQLKQCVSQIRSFFRSRGKWALVDLYQNSIVVLFQAAAFSELDETMEDELMKDLLDEGLHLALTKCMSITSIQNIQNMYELYEAYFDTVRMIYPTRSTFDLYDLSFAEKIKSLRMTGIQSQGICTPCSPFDRRQITVSFWRPWPPICWTPERIFNEPPKSSESTKHRPISPESDTGILCM